MSLRYRRLPADQLPRLLGAAVRAGATEESGSGAGPHGSPQGSRQLALHGRHGRGATVAEYGASNVRVASILSAVRGDPTSVRGWAWCGLACGFLDPRRTRL